MAQVVEQLKKEALFTSKVLSLLDALQQTQEGAAIYEHVKSILEFYEIDGRHIHEAYANLLTELLDAYLDLLPENSPLRVHLVMVQKRLMPPLTISELTSLREYINNAAAKINQGSDAGFSAMEKALKPLLQSFGIKTPHTRPAQAVRGTPARLVDAPFPPRASVVRTL